MWELMGELKVRNIGKVESILVDKISTSLLIFFQIY